MSETTVRVRSAKGQPPCRKFMRRCAYCEADFLGLAPGKTGLRGLWDNCGDWWCSVECYDRDHADAPYDAAEDLPVTAENVASAVSSVLGGDMSEKAECRVQPGHPPCAACFAEKHAGHDIGWRHENGRLESATCHDCLDMYRPSGVTANE